MEKSIKGNALFSIRTRLKLLLVLFWHVLLPLFLIMLLGTVAQQDSATWLAALFASATYIAFISMGGAWSWFGVNTQRALALLLVAAAIVTRPRYLAVNTSAEAAEVRLICIGLGLWFLLRTILVLLGRRAGSGAMNLTFPLRDGRYIVGQGGSTRAVNRHAGQVSQRYALDIVQLGRFGIRAIGLYPTDLKRYAIFGSDVCSPCDGTVVAAVDEYPDHHPPERDAKNPAGNFVAIETDGAVIYLAHLMANSVIVNAGQRVRTGQRLGRVGNSGNTSEPHLHIHAERGQYTGSMSSQAGVPLRFGGRFLVRNDVVDALG